MVVLICYVICVCVYVCVCVAFVKCGFFDNSVGVLIICVLVFTVILYCFVYVCVFLFVTSVKDYCHELKLNCSIG